MFKEIERLKKEKDAIILAHYYQRRDIQDVADYIGDSLGLAQEAAKTNAKVIVFAGVHFMAETAKILNPEKKVLLPDLEAGCSLEQSCPPAEFKKFIEAHPGHMVVSYINCSLEVKAMSDYICTSANAEKIINTIPADKPILFAPDKNLGNYLIKKTGRDMLLWNGACIVHEAFSMDKLVKLMTSHPNAKVVIHPESEEHILKLADFIGSTTGMINYIKKSPAREFIVGTEAGILHQTMKEAPGKVLIPAPSVEDNTCSCSECAFMKVNTLEKLYLCLKNETPEILIPEELRKRALLPITRMLNISSEKPENKLSEMI